MMKKRSDQVILTTEAKVLKELRNHHKLSMRKAGELIGKSDTYISHIENGRMDIPQGEKLQALLNIYGGIKYKSFRERVRLYREKTTEKDLLLDLVDKFDDSKIHIILNLAKSLAI